MSKVKVIHCISRLKSGGAQTQIKIILNNSNFDKYEVSVLCWDSTLEQGEKLISEIEVIELKNTKKIPRFIEIFRFCFNSNAHILQLWLPEMMTIPAALGGYFSNKKIIACERRVPVNSLSKLWFRDRFKLLGNCFATILITNFPLSKSTSFGLKWLFKKKNGLIIYNGIDFKKIAKFSLEPNDYNFNTDYNIAFVGRLVPEKGLKYLIEAINQLKKKIPQIKVHIFGIGNLEPELRSIIGEKKLTNYFVFHGYQSNWYSFVKKCDLFVLPTLREGMPNVLFEAACLEIPIVTTNIPEIACHFTNRQNCILIKPEDSEMLTLAINSLYKNKPLSQQLAENANKSVKKYSISTMVANYERIYTSI